MCKDVDVYGLCSAVVAVVGGSWQLCLFLLAFVVVTGFLFFFLLIAVCFVFIFFHVVQ